MSGKPSTKFTYLKPSENDSPYYVHITLNEDQQSIRIYYHMSWWKREDVDKDVFTRWMTDFRNAVPCFYQNSNRSTKKTPIKSRANSVRIRGRCKVYSIMLKDLVGFVEKDTPLEIPVKMECYTNIESKMIEIELTVDYKHLGHLPRELYKLPIFTTNPDYETIRKRLLFFNMKYIVGFEQGKNTHPLSNISLPKHDGSPSLSSFGQKSSSEYVADNRDGQTPAEQSRELEDFKLDPAYCTGEHPFGTLMSTNAPRSEDDHGKIDPNATNTRSVDSSTKQIDTSNESTK
jgi:hypothetical protein